MKYLSMLIAFLILFSCQQKENSNSIKHTVEKVIFDTDMGSDCDDVGALALLQTFADQRKVEIIGCIYSSGTVPYGAGVIDAINVYYGRTDIPIGANYSDEVGDPVDKMLAEKLAKNTVTFHNKIVHNRDAIEQTRLNRMLLSSEADSSITYITVGHTKALYDLLQSEADEISSFTGRELINKKVKRWVALGALGADNPEGNYRQDWNFFRNGTAVYTDFLIKNLDIPIYYINGGSKVMTGKSLIDTPDGNIVREAYEQWLWNYEGKKLSDQRPSWDLATVCYAIEGKGKFFEEAKPGVLEFDPELGCKWIDRPDEQPVNQFYISQKEGVDEEFADYLNEMIAKNPRLNN